MKDNILFLVRDLAYYKKKVQLSVKRKGKKLLYCTKKNSKVIYPTTVQLPITNACNLDCVMCNIHGNKMQMISIKDFEKKVIKSKLLKNVDSVGINGGEPFLVSNIEEYIRNITLLPNLKNIFIISNGLLTNRIVEKLKIIKRICGERKIHLTISFSMDGIGEVHDRVRNKKGAFSSLMETVDIIKSNMELYCDNLNFICTISKYNVEYLSEVDYFAKRNHLQINYNIATIHKRLKNDSKFENFTILNDRHSCLLAAEFFYRKFYETNIAKYYALYLYLYNEPHVRYGECQYLHNAITITPEGGICYCATWSKVLGNIYEGDLETIYFENQKYNDVIKNEYCKNCSHYLIDINSRGTIELDKARLNKYGKAW